MHCAASFVQLRVSLLARHDCWIERLDRPVETIEGSGHSREITLYTGQVIIEGGVERIATRFEVAHQVIRGLTHTGGECASVGIQAALQGSELFKQICHLSRGQLGDVNLGVGLDKRVIALANDLLGIPTGNRTISA